CPLAVKRCKLGLGLHPGQRRDHSLFRAFPTKRVMISRSRPSQRSQPEGPRGLEAAIPLGDGQAPLASLSITRQKNVSLSIFEKSAQWRQLFICLGGVLERFAIRAYRVGAFL